MKSNAGENLLQPVTIVTISKDDTPGLLKTIESLTLQSYSQWKLLVILSSQFDHSRKWVEEMCLRDARIEIYFPPQAGIYQAMNFGLEKVKSKYVWFMNGGDQFATDSSLEFAVVNMDRLNAGVLMGGYQFEQNGIIHKFQRRAVQISPRRFSLNIRSGNHQAMVFSMNAIKAIKFDTRFPIAADFKFVLDVLKEGQGFRVNEVLAQIELGGISDINVIQVWSQKQAIREEYFGNSTLDSFFGIIWTAAVRLKQRLFNKLR